MSRSKVKDTAVKGYIRLPKGVRKITDPLIQNRAIPQDFLDKSSEKGKQWLKKKIVGKRRKRR